MSAPAWVAVGVTFGGLLFLALLAWAFRATLRALRRGMSADGGYSPAARKSLWRRFWWLP